MLLLIYSTISSYGIYLLKSTQEILSYGFFIGAVFYVSGFFLWLFILRSYPLSIAFPMAAGALIIATQMIGAIFLNEILSLSSMMGSGLIIVGIILISSEMVKG